MKRKKISFARFPFAEELTRPLHNKSFRAQNFILLRNEFEIDKTWRILIHLSKNERLRMAADDLQRFLKTCMEIDVPVGFWQESNFQVIPGKTIVLTTSPEPLKPKELPKDAEGFALFLNPARIVIYGVDESGVQYGVHFLENEMRFREGPAFSSGYIKRSPVFKTRIYRSVLSPYNEDEIRSTNDYYSDEILSWLSHHGFNGIWLHGVLRRLADTKDFPEFGRGASRRYLELKRLVERSTRYGIKVYLYFTEPLALPSRSEFFKRHPRVKGMRSKLDGSFALCTSTPEVKRFLKEGMGKLFSEVPGLSGVILITASEHHHHCYSHVDTLWALDEWHKSKTIECPRCRKRSPSEVVAEIINLIYEGINSVSPSAKVIAWTWSWNMYEKAPYKGIIDKLRPEIILMVDFERGGRCVHQEVEYEIDEYSLTYVGPSERFKEIVEYAKGQGRQTFGRVQIGTTHEDGSIPYLPVMGKLVQKFVNLGQTGLAGLMECWNFGNFLSLSTEIANTLSWAPAPKNIQRLLKKYAAREFANKSASMVVKAWKQFDAAGDHYPKTFKLICLQPMSRAPAYPFFFERIDKPMPFTSIPGEMGDRLKDWVEPLGVQKVVQTYEYLMKKWGKGIAFLEKALWLTEEGKRADAIKHVAIAKAFLCQVRSTVNFACFTYLRDEFLENSNALRTFTLLKQMEDIIHDEIRNISVCRELCCIDSRIGFHAEIHGYLFNPEMIDTKIKSLREILSKIRRLFFQTKSGKA